MIKELLGAAFESSFAVEAYCAMPDHLHALVTATDTRSDLQIFVHQFKQATAYAFKRSTDNALWHRSYYDHVLRADEPSEPHARYILNNPIRAGLVSLADEWPYSGPEEALVHYGGADRSEDLSLRDASLVEESLAVRSAR